MIDSPDHSEEPLPVRRLQPTPIAPSFEGYDEYPPEMGPASSGKRVSLKLVYRAIRRHWWQALALWVIGSGALLVLAYAKIQPTFDAVSQVAVEMADLELFAKSSSPIDFSQYMQSQAAKITSPPVVGSALAAHPELLGYHLLRTSADPEIEVRQIVRVAQVPKTNFIQVEMSSTIPGESSAVVNAVVEAYLKSAQEVYDSSTQKLINHLKEMRDEQKGVVEKQRTSVEALLKRIDTADMEAAKDRNVATIETYREWSKELTRVEIMRIAAKSELDQLRNEKVSPGRALDEGQVLESEKEAFLADPRVLSLQAEIERADRDLKAAQRVSRLRSDPAVVRQMERMKALTDKWEALWRKLEPGLHRQVVSVPVDASVEQAIKTAESNLTAMATQEETYRSKLDKLRVENKAAQGEALKLEFARRDLQRAEEVFDTIRKNLEQRQYEAKNPIARINLLFKAVPTRRANSDRRTQVMAAAPLATGLLVVGLLILLELHGARVSDPEELSSRVHLQVIGVVPPLPQIRAGTAGMPGGDGGSSAATHGDLRAQRQLDEFVQSLDHLRVALCARRDPWGRDRHCVLITSACGSEGKTTLAAQLAERCVNAGLMTLLIDADLRNPTLSRMLDASDNPGLINVLRGEMMAEDVVMVIGDAGGFHLLPAGTPRVDPSRLLQSERLGKLIAQARESFDMIIVDAPPVLPVPDALTIGRWTDGAVLAVRYDTSRFPLVERANRRLAHVGVPVIGAVLNGVRSMEGAYGAYSYGYGGVYGNTSSSSSSSQSSLIDD